MQGDFDRFIGQMALEGYLFSDKQEQFNYELWGKGTHNILFVTGISGSGKTTLAERLEKEHGAAMFELDGIDYHYDSSEKGLMEKLEKNVPEYAKIVKENSVSNNRALPIRGDLFKKLFDELIRITHQDSQTLYIIEGVQIIALGDKSIFNEPLIIMGTSMVKSLYRRIKRTGGKWTDALKNEFLQLCDYYIDSQRELNRFRKLR